MTGATSTGLEPMRQIPDDLAGLISLSDRLGDIVFVAEVPGDRSGSFRFVHVNQAFLTESGHPVGKLVGQPPVTAFGPEGEAMETRWWKAVEAGQPVRHDAVVVGKYIRSSVSPILDDSGRCTHVVGFTRNETEIEEDKDRLRALFVVSTEGAALLGPDLAMVEILHGEATVWGGRDPETMTGLNLTELIEEDDHQLIEDLRIGPGSVAGATTNAEARIRSADGEPRWAEISLTNLFHDPSVKAVAMTVRDCHDRRMAQIRVEQAESRMRALIANAADALIGFSLDQRVVLWNRVAAKMFGYSEQEILGSPMSRLLPEEMAERHSYLVQGFVESTIERRSVTPTAADSLVALRRDGTTIPVEIGLSKVPSKDGMMLMASVRDITQRLQAEKAVADAHQELVSTQQTLARAQKLEAVGQLAAGIAHEINTPMQYVGDNLHFLKMALERLLTVADRASELVSDENGAGVGHDAEALAAAIESSRLPLIRERAPKAVDDALAGAENVSRIVAAMKRFSHPGSEQKVPIDLGDSLATTIQVCRNEWKYAAELDVEIPDDLPLLDGDLGSLNQVWLNLIINAAHAIPDRHGDDLGRITITVSVIDDGDQVRVVFADNGPGIPPEHIDRVFDPFFTTKEVGRGTGQGLAIAHTVIVEEHDGSFHLDSVVGEGATFTIELPVNERAERRPEPKSESRPESVGGAGT